MSLWLSGANAWAGTARSFWTAEAGRQQAAATRQMMELWAPPGPGAKKKRRRKVR
ncbi:hypothetical protein QMO56_21755 [Roseomonas sp. E05]|uniref:hypothetical protein n=1 Tax=Roseomonas sp. E05 TaxID=3046310 RepID=UPI0024BA0105|nr:hypothetical protein [Roseomonas sp. E05]MDJ0390746.1 hypothetical protein [Roseomonas sp. E05]